MARKILIVEDDTLLESLTAEKLGKAGYQIIAGNNLAEARQKLTEKPEAVLLDLLLPDGDGLSFLEEIRKNPDLKSIPVIVFSNLSDEQTLSRAKSLGSTDFMIKSNFTLDELATRVKELLPQ